MTEKPNQNDGGPASILTSTQRDVLRTDASDDDRSDSQRRAILYRARERIREALNTDVPLLVNALDESEYQTVFDPADGVDPDSHIEKSGLPFVAAFLLRASIAAGGKTFDPDVLGERSFLSFTRTIERGTELYLSERHDRLADVEVSIDVTRNEPAETVADRLDDREGTPTGVERIELVADLARAGYSADEIHDLLGPRRPIGNVGPDAAEDDETLAEALERLADDDVEAIIDEYTADSDEGT